MVKATDDGLKKGRSYPLQIVAESPAFLSYQDWALGLIFLKICTRLEELKSVGRIETASRSCKVVADYVIASSDPLITTQGNEYLKNKLKCEDEIEAAVREKIEINELKLKSFKNASELVGLYHEINKPCATVEIELRYEASSSQTKNQIDKAKENMRKKVLVQLQKVNAHLFKA
ncbi:hypothetical protein AgCh_034703 [Apium graveolens]